jgi:signal transduction histidine kinase
MVEQTKSWTKPLSVAVTFVILSVVGYLDYITSYKVSFFIFYLIPIVFALRRVGVAFAVIISVLSVIVWMVTNLAGGDIYPNWFIPAWNAAQRIAIYLGVVNFLVLREKLEDRVRERTAALTHEMQERSRLEKELLEISEREQRRIGHDLHDSLCQHLTATALAGQVLSKKLADKSLPETAAANHLVGLVEEAIDLTRGVARNLHPVEMQAEGLIYGFQELAANTSERFKIACEFQCPQTVLLQDATANTHLYRIVQETITNAIRHGKAKHITIRLDATDSVINLAITDDGIGIRDKKRNNGGMGLRIMAYRASMIGATFDIKRLPSRGTRVTCTLPSTTAIFPDKDGQKE